jgi:uncharacterized protein
MYQWEGLDTDGIDALIRARDPLTHRLWLITGTPAGALVAGTAPAARQQLRVARFAQVAELSQFLSRVEPLRHGLRGEALIACRDRCRALTPLLDMQGTTEALRLRVNAALAPHLEVVWWGGVAALRESMEPLPRRLRALHHAAGRDEPLAVSATGSFLRFLLARHAPGPDTGPIVVYSRAPRPGKVKTRLIPALGARGASALQRRLLRQTLARAASLRPQCLELQVAPARRDPWLWQQAKAVGARLRVQPHGDLGRRMRASLAEATRQAPWAVLIGGDCPGLSARTIERAFAALQGGAEAVITPALDGGFGLIGAREPLPPALFRGVSWGGPQVMATVQRNARQTGLRLQLVDRCWDVDRPDDLVRLRRGQEQDYA